MLDIVRIRNNPKELEDALRKRMDNISLDEVLMWDEEKRKIGTERDELKNQKNIISKKIPILKKENVNVNKELEEIELLGDKILILSDKYDELDEKIKDFMDGLPNIPDDDVIGGGKENIKVIKTFKGKPKFNFKPKDHTTLATDLELIDYERGVKLGGQGSWIYTGVGAQLEWALLNYFINEHLKDKWQFMLVPHMLKYECGYAAGQFPKFKDEVYWLDGDYRKDGKFMLPTAETALVNVHRDEILKEEELPKKYFAYTPCYRREAGSSRVEERGTIRGHQFNKVELIQYTTEDDSERAFDEMLHKAEKLVQDLGLHYQVSKLAAGDCSASMCRTYDIEIWIPSMGIYKEVSSVSNSRDYQARRGNMKYRDTETGKLKYMHTLNASGLATSRLLPAILEQYQLEDGSVLIPEVLRPYMGGIDKISMPPKSKIRTLKNK